MVHAVVAAGLLGSLPRPAPPAGEAWPRVDPPDAFLPASAADGRAGAGGELAPGSRPVDPADWFRRAGRSQGTEGLAGALATLALAGNQPPYVSDDGAARGRAWRPTTTS